MDFLNSAVIGAKIRMIKAKERFNEFMAAQDGVSNVVSTILIILVVIAAVAVLWNFLGPWIKSQLGKLNDVEYST